MIAKIENHFQSKDAADQTHIQACVAIDDVTQFVGNDPLEFIA